MTSEDGRSVFETGLHDHGRHVGASDERGMGPMIRQVREPGLSKIHPCRKYNASALVHYLGIRPRRKHEVLNRAKGEEGTLLIDTLHRRAALRLDSYDVENERCVLQDVVRIGADRLTRTLRLF